jgi:hypothetical protein
LVREGLRDAAAGRATVASCAVAIARTRLSRAGLITGELAVTEEPELALYRQLAREERDPYGRYNAILREIVSFEFALDHRLGR